MLKSKKSIAVFSVIFTLCELILSFLVHTVKKKLFKYFAFFSIVLACLFAFLFFCEKADYVLIQAGLIFTVFSDFFLVITEPMQQLTAMLFFSAAQLCYCILLFKRDAARRRLHLCLRVGVVMAALLLTVLVLGENTDALSLVSLFYFANLALNVVWSFAELGRSRLLPFGLLLFMLCDVCVGLSVMNSSYIPLPEGSFLHFLAEPGFNLAWVFYIPAQTLIALSLAEGRIKTLGNERITS